MDILAPDIFRHSIFPLFGVWNYGNMTCCMDSVFPASSGTALALLLAVHEKNAATTVSKKNNNENENI